VTIFYVTHGLDSLARLCPRATWIDAGRIRKIGPTKSIVAAFRDSLENDISIMETRKMRVVNVERGTGKQRAAPREE
jgi:ABC-type glutathione transport system ATPase component